MWAEGSAVTALDKSALQARSSLFSCKAASLLWWGKTIYTLNQLKAFANLN